MTKGEKLMNRCFAAVFGSLGTGALVGALFFGATHQWLMVAVCAAMVWALLAETKEKQTTKR